MASQSARGVSVAKDRRARTAQRAVFLWGGQGCGSGLLSEQGYCPRLASSATSGAAGPLRAFAQAPGARSKDSSWIGQELAFEPPFSAFGSLPTAKAVLRIPVRPKSFKKRTQLVRARPGPGCVGGWRLTSTTHCGGRRGARTGQFLWNAARAAIL